MAIKFNVPYLAGNELEYVQQVLESNAFAGNGPFTRKAQHWLQERYQVPHVLLTHSCTAALEMSALLLDLRPGDEVILPSYTFATTGSAFLRTGATLVFCEIDPATMNLDPADVAKRITPQTRVIVPVHYGGIAAEMDELMALAGSRGIAVVEDAAQGLEARYRGRWLGTIAPLAALSFHETKNLHCGLGGALFINEPAYFDRAEDIWERGTDRGKLFKGLVDKYSWVEVGSSFYPSELQAAFLLAQLESIERNTVTRRTVYQLYERGLRPIAAGGYLALPLVRAHCSVNYHSQFIICRTVAECDALRKHLHDAGIQAFIGYVPLHSSRVGRSLGNHAEDLPLTEEYAQRVLRLPFHHRLSEADVQSVVGAIGAFFHCN